MPIQAPQWTEFLSCPICRHEFERASRQPISLACGHTLCRVIIKFHPTRSRPAGPPVTWSRLKSRDTAGAVAMHEPGVESLIAVATYQRHHRNCFTDDSSRLRY